MPTKEVTPRAQMCAVQTDQYIERQFQPFPLLPVPPRTKSEMETVKMAVALQMVGFDTLGKGDTGKVYDFNWKATNNAVRFFTECMKGDPVVAVPSVPNRKPSTAQQK